MIRCSPSYSYNSWSWIEKAVAQPRPLIFEPPRDPPRNPRRGPHRDPPRDAAFFPLPGVDV